MSRYIDADAFEYELKEIEAITAMTYKELGEDEEVGEISMPMFTIRNIMKRCTPIDIVRCKECRWRKQDKSCDLNCRIDYIDGTETDMWFYTEDDDFCSYGERRE